MNPMIGLFLYIITIRCMVGTFRRLNLHCTPTMKLASFYQRLTETFIKLCNMVLNVFIGSLMDGSSYGLVVRSSGSALNHETIYRDKQLN